MSNRYEIQGYINSVAVSNGHTLYDWEFSPEPGAVNYITRCRLVCILLIFYYFKKVIKYILDTFMEKPQKRLYRSITDRKIAGVCGGLATYFNIDSTIVRLLWIAGMIATGVLPGAFIYLIAALIIPKEPKKV